MKRIINLSSHLLLSALILISACDRGNEAINPVVENTGDGKGIPDPPFSLPSRIPVRDIAVRPSFVLIILIDTLRADYLGLHGCEHGLTPYLDSLGKCAAVFEYASAATTSTRGSVAAFFTSCYPSSIQVMNNSDLLQPDLLTLAEMFNVYGGYECIAVSTNGNAGTMMGFDQGFDEFYSPKERRGYRDERGLAPGMVVNKYAMKYISRWIKRGKKRPLFLFLHYVDPHAPYMEHPGLLSEPQPEGRFDGSRENLGKLDALSPENVKPEDYDRIKYLYAGEVRYSDECMGNLFASIREYDPELLDEMVFVITADHGEGLWNHGWRKHGHLPYEDQVHVPLLIHLPGMKPGDGIRIYQPVNLVDVAPTLLSICKIPKPDQFQGNDLSPLIRGGKREPAMDYVYSEVQNDHSDFESIRYGDWKVIRDRTRPAHDPGAYQMFDLSADPLEQKNMCRDGSMPEWGSRMIKALSVWSDAVKADADASMTIDITQLDKETLEQLRALGYLDAGDPER